MTEQDAAQIINKIWRSTVSTSSLLEMFKELGMLKLDEPKSAEDRFIELATERGLSKRDLRIVQDVLHERHLKIVEK